MRTSSPHRPCGAPASWRFLLPRLLLVLALYPACAADAQTHAPKAAPPRQANPASSPKPPPDPDELVPYAGTPRFRQAWMEKFMKGVDSGHWDRPSAFIQRMARLEPFPSNLQSYFESRGGARTVLLECSYKGDQSSGRMVFWKEPPAALTRREIASIGYVPYVRFSTRFGTITDPLDSLVDVRLDACPEDLEEAEKVRDAADAAYDMRNPRPGLSADEARQAAARRDARHRALDGEPYEDMKRRQAEERKAACQNANIGTMAYWACR